MLVGVVFYLCAPYILSLSFSRLPTPINLSPVLQPPHPLTPLCPCPPATPPPDPLVPLSSSLSLVGVVCAALEHHPSVLSCQCYCTARITVLLHLQFCSHYSIEFIVLFYSIAHVTMLSALHLHTPLVTVHQILTLHSY